MHVEETPLQMFKPGHGKAHRAGLPVAHAPTAYNSPCAVIFDLTPSRARQPCRTLLEKWRKLLTGGYSRNARGFATCSMELGCMAHSRHKVP